MPITDCRLSDFAPEHIDDAVALSRAAGWPHRREDWAFVLSLGRGTVAIADGRVVGTAMTTLFGESATVNMVIVDETMRGRGLGRRLMDAALAAAGERECRLVATEAGLPLYETLGFRATGRIVQQQGIARLAGTTAGEGVSWTSAPALDLLAALDRAACGMNRSTLFDRLPPESRVAVLERAGALNGFAVLRPFGRGEVVGPVVAPDFDDARALLAFALADRSGAFVRVDTPVAAELEPWLAECGLAPVGGGVAMRRGGAALPLSDVARTFALASQALG